METAGDCENFCGPYALSEAQETVTKNRLVPTVINLKSNLKLFRLFKGAPWRIGIYIFLRGTDNIAVEH